MLAHYLKKPHVVKRMQHCYFGFIFEDYILHLHNLGYKPKTIKVYCQAIEHFGRWLNELCINIRMKQNNIECES